MAGWDGCLDQLQDEVETLRALLDDVTADVAEDLEPSWSPPADLGPLPERCRPRAQHLLERLRTTVTELGARRGALGDQLGRDRDRRDAARTYGHIDATVG